MFQPIKSTLKLSSQTLTSFEDLENYLDRCLEADGLISEPYDQAIE